MASSKMTKCKSCGAEIAKSAKQCPSCGAPNKKPFYKKVWFWFLIIFLFLGVIGSTGSNSSNSSTSSINSSKETSLEVENQTEAPIEYTMVTVDEMVDLLSENALKAEKTYSKQYVEITGRLDVIDSDGKYIALYPENNDFSLNGVHCNIKNEDQLNFVINLNKGDTVTLKGKITDIGELMGYSLDIIEFVD